MALRFPEASSRRRSTAIFACGLCLSRTCCSAAQADCAAEGTCAAAAPADHLLLQLSPGAELPRPLKLSQGIDCLTAEEGHPCWEHVKWAMEVGFPRAPDMYPGLAATSSSNDFQRWLYDRNLHGCPLPCPERNAGGQDLGQPPPAPVPPAPMEVPSATPAPPDPQRSVATGGAGSPRFVVQDGAVIPPGGRVRLYVVGTSNVVWQTWPDQLNALLVEMGYDTTPGNFTSADVLHPKPRAPICENAASYESLETPRIGKVGWSSWGFAFESKGDCQPEEYEGAIGEDGFRTIAGHKVSCINSWACNPVGVTKTTLVRPSDVAKDTRDADIVLLSNWMNDSKQRWASFKCFRGEPVDLDVSTGSAEITIASMRTLIRAIHAQNPQAVVLIMARYPDAVGTRVHEPLVERIAELNAVVRAALEQEPNTFFVDYEFPLGVDIFQIQNPGHPNCRGDGVMATKVLEVLFERRVLGRGLRLPTGEDAERCALLQPCSAASSAPSSEACCQRAALCNLNEQGACLEYGPGASPR